MWPNKRKVDEERCQTMQKNDDKKKKEKSVLFFFIKEHFEKNNLQNKSE
jgi:hypothetical protein